MSSKRSFTPAGVRQCSMTRPSGGDAVSQSGEQLKSGQLGTADVTASTVANIGPGIDFYFGFGVIAVTAGVAAPLTILAATVAVALLAFTVAEFTRAEPSAGSFITYVETALGARAGVATALLVTVGYTVAIAAVFTMSGGLVAMTLSHYTSWHPWWGPFSLVLTAGAIWLTARGVKLSTTAAGAAVLVQVAIMVAVCLLVLVDQRAALSGIPFSWAHLTGGLAGLSAGFPLALFMFIGWENGPALAEEARNPRRTIPRALYISVAIAAALLVFRNRVRARHPGRRGGFPVAHAVRRRPDGVAAGQARPGPPAVRHTGERAAVHGGRRAGDHRSLVGDPPHHRGHRIDEPGRPVCRVLDDGDHRDPLRLLPHDALASRDSFSPIRHVAIPALGSITLIVP